MMDRIKKIAKKILMGTPVRGEPISTKGIYKTTMPIQGVSIEEWKAGKWHFMFNRS